MATKTATSGAGSKTRGTGSSSKRTDTDTGDTPDSATPSLASQLGLDRLADEFTDLGRAWADRGVHAVTDRLDGLTDKVSDSLSSPKGKAFKNVMEGDSKPVAALKAGIESVKESGTKGVSEIVSKVGDVFSGDSKEKGKKDKKFKFINIVETLDLPVPRPVAYRAWTEFEEFPSFMKKVEHVEQKEDETVEWKAQIFWSHRSWTAEIVDQVPNERIVWRSKGEKGHVDGAVTFHELTPDLTRMLINLEYYPQGLFERTGNLWRAQGRRVRLELKFFRRYVTSDVLLRQDEVEGWPGEIHEGEVMEKSEVQDSEPASRDKGADGATPSPSAPKGSAKKATSNAPTSSRPRAAAKKAPSSESSPSRPRPAAKKSTAGSGSSGRGSRAEKSTSSSRRSRS